MSTGGGVGYNPNAMNQGSDKSLMGKVKDALKPSSKSSTMPDNLAHQDQDTSGGITNALKPGKEKSATSSAAGDATRQMTSKMSNNTPDVSGSMKPGLPGSSGGGGGDPGSVGSSMSSSTGARKT